MYLKDKPPPLIDLEYLVTVIIDIEITKILLIDEVTKVHFSVTSS